MAIQTPTPDPYSNTPDRRKIIAPHDYKTPPVTPRDRKRAQRLGITPDNAPSNLSRAIERVKLGLPVGSGTVRRLNVEGAPKSVRHKAAMLYLKQRQQTNSRKTIPGTPGHYIG